MGLDDKVSGKLCGNERAREREALRRCLNDLDRENVQQLDDYLRRQPDDEGPDPPPHLEGYLSVLARAVLNLAETTDNAA